MVAAPCGCISGNGSFPFTWAVVLAGDGALLEELFAVGESPVLLDFLELALDGAVFLIFFRRWDSGMFSL